MQQVNVLFVGDQSSGKTTLLQNFVQEEEEQQGWQPYYSVKMKGSDQMVFNMFELNSNLNKLQRNVHRLLRSDVIVYVFGMVEDENGFYKESHAAEIKGNQNQAYNSYIQPLLEVIDLDKKDQKVIVVLNKIDHDQVNFDDKQLDKAKQFVKLQFVKSLVDPNRIIFVPISALKKMNIIVSMEEYNESFCEALLRCVKFNQDLGPQVNENYQPFVASIIKQYKQLGQGIIIQAYVEQGSIQNGSSLKIMPKGITTRIKKMEVYGESVQQANKGMIIGLNLADIWLKDVPNGSVLLRGDQEEAALDAQKADLLCEFFFTFNGIYEGFQVNLIGAFQSISCKILKIDQIFCFDKEAGISLPVSSENNPTENVNIIRNGNLAQVQIMFLGKNYLDYPQNSKRFGQFVIMESNVILGIGTIRFLYNSKGDKILQKFQDFDFYNEKQSLAGCG